MKAIFHTPLSAKSYCPIETRSSGKSRWERPVTHHGPPERAQQGEKGAQRRGEAAVQPTRRADADQVALEQAEIEATGMNQLALSNVGVAAEVHATHPAGLMKM